MAEIIPETEITRRDKAREQVLDGRTPARSLLLGMRAWTRFMDRVYFAMGWVCGMQILLLAGFITYQSVARKAGWTAAPNTDMMSGFVLAMAATWAFSYSLRTGSHVRIDILLPLMSARLRAVVDWVALGAMAFFATVVAWKMWDIILVNYHRGSLTHDYPLTPLWIPKIVVGIGFSVLALTAINMMVDMIAEWLLPKLHKRMGGVETYRQAPAMAGGTDGVSTAAPATSNLTSAEE